MDHPLIEIGTDAIRFGYEIGKYESDQLSEKLYRYGSTPLTKSWAAKFQNVNDIDTWLNLGDGSIYSERLNIEYERHHDAEGHWTVWRHRRGISSLSPCFKIYISVSPDSLPDIFRLVVPILFDMGVPLFKVAATANDLLRTDHFVLFMPGKDNMFRVANELLNEIAHYPAAGVPFTIPFAFSKTNHISYAIDPAQFYGSKSVFKKHSWRYTVVTRLVTMINSLSVRPSYAEIRNTLNSAIALPMYLSPSLSSEYRLNLHT